MIKHSRALVIPILISLGLGAGLFREVYLAYLFGTSREIEIFRVAFGLPSILSESLAVSFVSVLITALLADSKNDRLKQATWAGTIVAVAVFIIGFATMPLQASILAPGIVGDNRETLIIAGKICWGMTLFSILALPMRANMSLKHRLWPGASTALFRSGGFIAVLAILVSTGIQADAVTAACAALAAGFAVYFMHLMAQGNSDRSSYIKTFMSGPDINDLKPLFAALTLVFVTQLLLSGGRVIDRAVSSQLADGTLAAIEYSYAIMMAIASLAGTSANIVLAPRIGKLIKSAGYLPCHYWKLIIGIVVVATFGGLMLAASANLVVSLIFEHGAFHSSDTEITARALRIHALALGPLVLSLILTQTLILSNGQRWLVPLATLKLTVKIIALWLLLRAGYGLEGIAISFGIAEVAMAAALISLNRPLYSRA